MPNGTFPVNLTIDYPDKPLDKLSTFFRLITVIPILIILGLLRGMYVAVPLVLMLLFRRKYPRWWYDWNSSLVKFEVRVSAYLSLLRDEYPSTDEEQAVHVVLPYPDASQLSRWLPLVKWFLAIPHYIVLAVLAIIAIVGAIIAWFAILFTGRYPRSIFDFVVGFLRWALRVTAYAFILTTDEYPPFSLSE